MMDHRTRKNVCSLLALTLLCLAGWSCSGDNDSTSLPEVPTVPADPDALCTLTPRSIGISSVDVSATPITRSATTGKPEQQATYSANLGYNSSVEATLEAAPQEAQTRAAGSLTENAQYRVVIFNSTTGAIMGNVVYKQGSTAIVSGKEIKLKAGTYRLFCYTFNSTASIRDLNTDNQNVTVNTGEDFMTYTNASFTISTTDYGSGKALNISFVRQCARLTLTVNAEEYDDNNITHGTVTIGNIFGSGNRLWNGSTNTDAATLPILTGTTDLTKASANGSSVDFGPDADTPYSILSPCTNQTINISVLYVDFTGKGKVLTNISFPNVTLAKGGSYQLTVNVGNYYLPTNTNPVTIGGLKWARTNLLQTGSGNRAPVSFVANPWDEGSEWQWGMRDATRGGSSDFLGGKVYWRISSDGDEHQDPCRSLGSGWRLPSSGEMAASLAYKAPDGIKVKINGTIYTVNGGMASGGFVYLNDDKVIYIPTSCWSDTSSIDIPIGEVKFPSSYALRADRGKVDTYIRDSAVALRCVQD